MNAPTRRGVDWGVTECSEDLAHVARHGQGLEPLPTHRTSPSVFSSTALRSLGGPSPRGQVAWWAVRHVSRRVGGVRVPPPAGAEARGQGLAHKRGGASEEACASRRLQSRKALATARSMENPRAS